MAGRPARHDLDYAGWSADIFDNDTKIDKLLDAQGWNGFGIYFFLCQRAYGSEGYFYRWGYDDCASTARKMGGGICSGTVRETVGYCFQIGLFDKGLFDRWGVLTSRGIQRRYWAVASERRDKTVIAEYWLLQSEECKGAICVQSNINMLADNSKKEVNNANLSADNTNYKPLKESKVKESKKKNIVHPKDINALFECLWKLYPNKRGKAQVSDAKKKAIYEIGSDEMIRALDRYKNDLQNDDWRKPQNGSTFFNSGYVDYLDDNYSKPQNEKKVTKNSFNSFEQREYDFEDIEKKLLRN